MTIYIVVRSDWRSDNIVGVYTDKARAEAHAASLDKPGVHGSVVAKEVIG